MQRDKLHESIPWFERAKQAKRYEPRQFPFMNLGRIYLRQFHHAAKMLHHLRARLN